MYDGCVLVEDRGHQSNRKLAIFPHFVISPLSRFVGTKTLGDLPLLSSWQNKSRKIRKEQNVGGWSILARNKRQKVRLQWEQRW